jgi:hypothetical protein
VNAVVVRYEQDRHRCWMLPCRRPVVLGNC